MPMVETDKTKETLLEEVALLRARLAQVENAAAHDRRGEEFVCDMMAGDPDAFTWGDVLQSIPDALIAHTMDAVIVGWNPAAERLYGYAAGEVYGKPLGLLIPPERAAEPLVLIERMRRGERLDNYETLRLRKDGARLHVSVSAAPIKNAAGRIVGATVTHRDITEMRRVEQRLQRTEETLLETAEQYRQAQKMEAVGRLAGGVAHDFNNLLTIILGYGDILLGSLGPDDPARDLITEIHKAGERAASLTRQLLAFSRKQVLEPRVLDLNVLVTDLERMLRRLIGEDIRLATVLDSALGRVRADPGQLEQVILNLAVNARDAMPQGGQLTLGTCNVELDDTYADAHVGVAPGPYVQLSVSDTGCGMDEATQAHLFEPFFTTKGVGKGTGLGLATVYGIVKQSGGHIEVYSEVEHGTTFKVYLPPVEAPLTAGAKSPADAPPFPAGHETLLLVEDEDAVRVITRHVLERCGYIVLEAQGGKEAIQICEEYRNAIHLLVTDVVMPHMSGRQLAEQLKQLHPEMKVLYLSGYSGDAVVRHGVLEAEDAFLQKPFSASAVAYRVREILDH
jgi:PAS domain S-box-containing protein